MVVAAFVRSLPIGTAIESRKIKPTNQEKSPRTTTTPTAQ